MSSNLYRATYDRQYKHVAVIAHGAHPEYRLEFDAEVDGTDTNVKSIYQGSVVSLNSSGKFVLGVGTSTKNVKPVPMISMKNITDPDVTTGVGTVTKSSTTSGGSTVITDVNAGYLKNYYSAVGGKITAIPCTGSYEIETTEFDQTGSYAINQALLAGTAEGKVGYVVPAGPTTDITAGAAGAVVGFVSKTPFDVGEYGHKRIAFFANFIPQAIA